MAEKSLSQAEIDALLNQMNSGGTSKNKVETEDKIKKYDFRSPKKFTKEQLKTLDGLFENYSRMLSSHFSGSLRLYSEVTVVSIEEQRYFEYNNALPDSALIGMIDIKPADKHYSEGIMLMDMSTSLGYFMIDRLLGGAGKGSNLNRDYTDIEIAILNRMLTKILARLEESWSNYVETKFELSSIETNARLLQALGPEDIVVIIMLNVKVRGQTGTLNICIPAENLEEMIGNFSIKYTRTSKKQLVEDSEAKKQLIFNSLLDTELELKAVLDRSQLPLSDILNLQVDDVIPLAKDINSDIFVTVDDSPWYTAKLGEMKVKKAIRLNGTLNQ